MHGRAEEEGEVLQGALRGHARLQFNDFLTKRGIDPKDVLVLRHTPSEAELRKVLPWLAAGRTEVFEAYQRAQSPAAEAGMLKRGYVASFIACDSIRNGCLFVGLYRRTGGREVLASGFWDVPHFAELRKYGMAGLGEGRDSFHLFDLEPVPDFWPELRGRLVCEMPEGRNFTRRAEANVFRVEAIHEDSVLEGAMPPWESLTIPFDELKALPRKWRAALSQWRGVYFILDRSDGKGYVGSAGGAENLLGRWETYASNGHGGNEGLKGRDPSNFVFSILQRVSPDMPLDELTTLESGWKVRLHTFDHGLNRNR